MSPAGGTMTTHFLVLVWTHVSTILYKVVDYSFSISAALTCRPMMLRPSLSFSGAKRRCCFSAYFTPKSYLERKPLDLALEREREVAETEGKMLVIPILFLLCYCCCHTVVLLHATQSTHIGRLVVATCIKLCSSLPTLNCT